MNFLAKWYLSLIIIFNNFFNRTEYSYTADSSVKINTLPEIEDGDNGTIALFKIRPHIQNNLFELVDINNNNYTLSDIETNQTFTVNKETFDIVFKRVIVD